MLGQCAAIHMAPDRNWTVRCGEIVREAGMGESCLFLSVEDIARRVRKTPVQFLIVNYRVETADLQKVIAGVRSNHEAGVKFMPIIIFTRDSSATTALHFLKMGCDDIITFPCTIDYLAERLTHQIARRIDYVHQGDYFGPDRRQLHGEEEEPVKDQFSIHRDPAHGIKILSQSHQARHAG